MNKDRKKPTGANLVEPDDDGSMREYFEALFSDGAIQKTEYCKNGFLSTTTIIIKSKGEK